MKNIIDFNQYEKFLAECYEEEDEIFEDLIQNYEIDFWINSII